MFKSKNKPKNLIRLKTYLGGLFFQFNKIPRGKFDILFIHHDVDKSVSLNHKAYSPLLAEIDLILKNNNFTTTFFSVSFSRLVGEKSYHNCWSMNWIFLIRKITDKFIFFSRQKSFFVVYISYLLRRLNVRYIISIGADPQITEAARNLGIPFIEVLHGFGYATDDWKYSKRKISALPTHLISFDRVSSETFSKACGKFTKIIEAKYPIFTGYNNLSPAQFEEWVFEPNCNKTKKVIIFFLQWGYGGEIPHLENILENCLFPIELLKVISETKNDIHWLFRMHPVQNRKEYYNNQRSYLKQILKKYSNAEFEKCSEKPLNSVLKKVDGAMSMSSMAVYDAAAFGVKSLLFCPSLRGDGHSASYFKDLEESGFTQKIEFDQINVHKWLKNIHRVDQGYKIKGAPTLEKGLKGILEFR